MPINYKIARAKHGYIQLCVENDLGNVYEHISPLRSLGYDGIALKFHDKWPPYCGGVRAYLAFFKKELRFKTTDDDIPYIGPSQSSEAFRKDRSSFVKIVPVSDKRLHMDVLSQWRPLPTYRRKFVFEAMSLEDQQRIWDAKPQGDPQYYRKLFAKVLHTFGWPNMQHISWKSDGTPHQIAEEWWYHAVQDTIGAVNLCDHIALPAASVKRAYGGHALDLEAVKKAFQ